MIVDGDTSKVTRFKLKRQTSGLGDGLEGSYGLCGDLGS